MLTLSPQTVLRPESQGAILFQRERAETAFLDMEGLEALYALCARPGLPGPAQSQSCELAKQTAKGSRKPGRYGQRDMPLGFLSYLLSRGFLVRASTLPEVPNLREGAAPHQETTGQQVTQEIQGRLP